jgi:hypothetical protein
MASARTSAAPAEDLARAREQVNGIIIDKGDTC